MNSVKRTIRVPILTRVEGEGSLSVKLNGKQIDDVQLRIFEPPRFFEALLRGRALEDVADITSRICGICPIAYQMTAVQALEQALQIRVAPEIQSLRELMYYAEWIESHALHIHLLQAPDFFDCASGIELAKQYPNEVSRGLKLKKVGNSILELLGGRAIHPINLAVGGFYRLPSTEQLRSAVDSVKAALEAAIEAVSWIAAFPIPHFVVDYDFVAISNPNQYAIISGEVCCSDGFTCSAVEYEQHFNEQHVPHSTALHSQRINSKKPYFVGPLARVNLNFDQLSTAARDVASRIGFSVPCYNPYYGIVARGLEIVHAYEKSLEILSNLQLSGVKPRVQYGVKECRGVCVTEAPRGLIYHRYEVDQQGRIVTAKIVPPTSQNQAQIEADLRQRLPAIIDKSDSDIATVCEQLIRNYDPCISCSTHFLKVRIER